MLTDIEIAKSVKMRPINEVAAELGIHEDQVENYGRYIAKITTDKIDTNKFKNHHLILVTAISRTKAGNGKTTVSVGLALGMQKIGKKSVVALREPSLGPCFGMKGATDEEVEPIARKLKLACEGAGATFILVTAISPTKAGNGKTTVSVGLALGMQKIGKKAVVALREPSLGSASHEGCYR